jgi:hypothetical protein
MPLLRKRCNHARADQAPWLSLCPHLPASWAVHPRPQRSCLSRSRTVATARERRCALLESVLVPAHHVRNGVRGRQGRALRSSRLPPIRPRSWWAGTRFRWSGACTATLSGAVRAGSNPAGGAGRRINSNALTILDRLSARRLTCGNADAFRTVPPEPPPEAGPQPPKAQLSGQQ